MGHPGSALPGEPYLTTGEQKKDNNNDQKTSFVTDHDRLSSF
jgi:hypothetical protein